MNGKPLIYRGFADFNEPERATEISKHTTFETFEASQKRLGVHGQATYGWLWAEYTEERLDELPNIVKKPRLRELILRPHREWDRARIQARKENELVAIMTSYAACCLKMTHCLEDHHRTARHFRYWVLEYQGLALKTWPWLKNLIAEEVLT